ncbi:MAG: hypothetical protein M1504_01010 [Candidatus Marsarchaeota archaeon]|nr:hypothetical protein [Candidatus Marsarchaeota archaeon]
MNAKGFAKIGLLASFLFMALIMAHANISGAQYCDYQEGGNSGSLVNGQLQQAASTTCPGGYFSSPGTVTLSASDTTGQSDGSSTSPILMVWHPSDTYSIDSSYSSGCGSSNSCWTDPTPNSNPAVSDFLTLEYCGPKQQCNEATGGYYSGAGWAYCGNGPSGSSCSNGNSGQGYDYGNGCGGAGGGGGSTGGGSCIVDNTCPGINADPNVPYNNIASGAGGWNFNPVQNTGTLQIQCTMSTNEFFPCGGQGSCTTPGRNTDILIMNDPPPGTYSFCGTTYGPNNNQLNSGSGLSILETVCNYVAIYPQSWINAMPPTTFVMGANVLPPGASTYINYTIPLQPGEPMCPISYIMIAPPGKPCNPTFSIPGYAETTSNPAAYCNENSTNAPGYGWLCSGGTGTGGSGSCGGTTMVGTGPAWPQCLLNYNNESNPWGDNYDIYNSAGNAGQEPWVDNTLTDECQYSYFMSTNSVPLLQGNYTVCAFYKFPGSATTFSTQTQLNVTGNVQNGPGYGYYLYFANQNGQQIGAGSTFSTSSPISVDGQQWPTGPFSPSSYQATFNPGSNPPPLSCSVNYMDYMGTSPDVCLYEIAANTPTGGCIPPLTSAWPYDSFYSSGAVYTTTLPICNSPLTSLPCLVYNSQASPSPSTDNYALADLGTVSISGSTFVPSNSYDICAYDYNTYFYPGTYQNCNPNNPTSSCQAVEPAGNGQPGENIAPLGSPTGSNQNGGGNAGPNADAPLLDNPTEASPFFATASVTCNSIGTCTVGGQYQAGPFILYGSTAYFGAPFGTFNVIPSVVSLGNSPPSSVTIIANAYDVGFTTSSSSSQTSANLYTYIVPFGKTPFVTIKDACTGLTQSIKNQCSNSNGDFQNGCYVEYQGQTGNNNGGASSSNGCTVDTSGYPGTSCTAATTLVPGCYSGSSSSSGCNQNPMSTEIITTMSPSISSTTPANTYLLCDMLTEGGSAPEYVAGAFLFILPAGQTYSPSNLGEASSSPFTGEVCSVYYAIESVFIIVTLVIMLIGAGMYAFSHVLPGTARGPIQSYAFGMFIAGVVGVALGVAAIYIISLVTNTAISPSAICNMQVS